MKSLKLLSRLALTSFVLCFFCSLSHASDSEIVADTKKVLDQTTTEVAKKVAKSLDTTQDRREHSNYLFMASYSPLDLIIPSKLGLTVGQTKSVDKTWELEILRGSLAIPFVIDNLGDVSDLRFSFIARSYAGRNSFNFSYGLSYFDFSARLGNKYLASVSGTPSGSVELLKIQTLGANFGIGNRWTIDKNFTFGVDWISWSQPLLLVQRDDDYLTATNSTPDRDAIEKALGLISYFPRISVLKIQIGVLF